MFCSHSSALREYSTELRARSIAEFLRSRACAVRYLDRTFEIEAEPAVKRARVESRVDKDKLEKEKKAAAKRAAEKERERERERDKLDREREKLAREREREREQRERQRERDSERERDRERDKADRAAERAAAAAEKEKRSSDAVFERPAPPPQMVMIASTSSIRSVCFRPVPDLSTSKFLQQLAQNSSRWLSPTYLRC